MSCGLLAVVYVTIYRTLQVLVCNDACVMARTDCDAQSATFLLKKTPTTIVPINSATVRCNPFDFSRGRCPKAPMNVIFNINAVFFFA